MDLPLARVREPLRRGQRISFRLTEDALPPDHPARRLWTLLGEFDLQPFYAKAKAVKGVAGRTLRSARVKLCLWGYAIHRGISSARELARLCRQDLAFLWISGGEPFEHSTLSRFRHRHEADFDSLFTQVVRQMQVRFGLDFQGTGRLTLAQDGTKIRADAAMGSFRGRQGLEDALTQSRLHQKAVEATCEHPAPTSPAAGAASPAQVRGARAAHQRRERAQKVAHQLQIQRANASDGLERKHPKASTTDPDARVMKMPHGGFEPAYNVQFAAAADPRGGPVAIVGVRVVQTPSDQGSLLPMIEQIEARTGQPVRRLVADANHVSQESLKQTEEHGTELVSRPPKNWKPSKEKKKKAPPTRG